MRRILSLLTAAVLLAGCAVEASPATLQYLADTQANCAYGDQLACARLPMAQYAVQEEREQARVANAAAGAALVGALLGAAAEAGSGPHYYHHHHGRW